MALKITVQAQMGQYWIFFFTEERIKSTTVLQLKTKITESEGVPEYDLRLTLAGRQLEDQRLLSDCGVKHGDRIDLALIRMRDSEGRSQAYQFPVQVKREAEATDSTEMAIQVRVRVFDRERIIGLCDTEEQLKRISVLQLKEKIQSVFNESGRNVNLQYGSRILEEGALLSAYGIRHMLAIEARFGFPGGGYSLGMIYRGMGDREGRNMSMEDLSDFQKCISEAQEPK